MKTIHHAKFFGALAIVLAAATCLFTVGCQSSYWDRNNTEAIQKAEERAAAAEKALTVVVAQKDNADKALAMAQIGLEAAKVAKLDAEKIAAAEKAVAFANEKKAQVFETAASIEKAVKEARAEAEKAKASGTGQSAAEHDAAIVGGILSAVGSLFGPVGAVGGMGAAGILGLIARTKSKQVTAAKDVIWAVEAAKSSAPGGNGVVDFNHPDTKKLLNKAMGASGKVFVDEVQRS